ncbi:hypothetical protein NP493_663g00036 [Ridgeia piscesae]|uniref:Rho-GAP domain-containing protein n=1 Tax=Ridgeia piscesae TaxID=27915 RepID=A0AAD9KSC3_RIDPI|nr:hypothetical protein NP493_663g00036 [Ridgeia piscesae]
MSYRSVAGVLKDFLRELPEPLFTNALYQMLLDALNVRLPEDPSGSARLMLSVLECLPKPNQMAASPSPRHCTYVGHWGRRVYGPVVSTRLWSRAHDATPLRSRLGRTPTKRVRGL